MKASHKALFLGLCMAASVVAVPTIASAGVAIDIDLAPPPVRVETVPPPRAGFVLAPGYWDYRGHDHVWVRGRWVAERHGYHWVPDRWDHGPNGWSHVAGRWDRNGNGVPDRYEHRADNRPMGDRDHDGIPNAYDNHPSNPYRR